MADKRFEFLSLPGIRRDGTSLESDYYADGVWVRWQRGKPRKMGGYRAMSQLVKGPVRSLLVDSRNGLNTAHYFSQWGIQRQQFSLSGAGGGVEDRTPLTLVPNPVYTWSHGIMASSTGGTFAALLAASTPDLNDITSDVSGQVWSGGMSDSAPLTPLSDSSGLLQVSGGVTVLQPFPVVYGSAGLIRIGNPNDLSSTTWDTGGSSLATTANPAGTKVVYGAPVRGGSQSPAGLFWALDALIRVSFNPGNTQALWQFDTLSNPITIMSKKAVVEHDGKYYWPGVDRFLFYNGVVQELPNQMNINWFMDNVNRTQVNKVWGAKVPRWGEIWWFYPRGSDIECGDAVIWNYVENTWYDAKKVRSAGAPPQLFSYPIWTGGEDSQITQVLPVGFMKATSAPTAAGNVLTFANTTNVANGQGVYGTNIPAGATVASFTGTTVTLSAPVSGAVASGAPIGFSSVTTPFSIGAIVTGATSGATSRVVRSSLTELNVVNVTGTYAAAENLTGSLGGAGRKLLPAFSQELHCAYQHELGVNKVLGQEVTALPSSFTSKHFGFAVGNPFGDQPQTSDQMTRIGKMELDFDQAGALEMTVYGRSYAQKDDRVLDAKTAQEGDSFVTFRTQERILSVKVESNVVDGNYEQGKVMFDLGLGDRRSSEDTGTEAEGA